MGTDFYFTVFLDFIIFRTIGYTIGAHFIAVLTMFFTLILSLLIDFNCIIQFPLMQ
jgi:hypothetical protein